MINPGIRSDKVILLGGAGKEGEVGLEELSRSRSENCVGPAARDFGWGQGGEGPSRTARRDD